MSITYTHTVTAHKADGTTKSVQSPYDDKDALMRLYDLTGYEVGDFFGQDVRWTGTLKSRFARSLVLQNEARNGDLSPTQWAWVHVLVVEAEQPSGPTDPVQLRRIRDLMDTAAETLKWPKVNLRTASCGRVRLARAGDRSRRPGVIHVTDGRPFGENTYYGSIELDGTWSPTDAVTPEVRSLLLELDRDPKATATAYGRRTGSCCFCSRELTDGRSVAVGYGPVCASRFDLPWGDDRASSTVEVKS